MHRCSKCVISLLLIPSAVVHPTRRVNELSMPQVGLFYSMRVCAWFGRRPLYLVSSPGLTRYNSRIPGSNFPEYVGLFRAFRELETGSMRMSCSERVFVTSKHALSPLVSMLSLDCLLLLIVCSDPPSQHNCKSTARLLLPVDALRVHVRHVMP